MMSNLQKPCSMETGLELNLPYHPRAQKTLEADCTRQLVKRFLEESLFQLNAYITWKILQSRFNKGKRCNLPPTLERLTLRLDHDTNFAKLNITENVTHDSGTPDLCALVNPQDPECLEDLGGRM